jgi:hypothetical protein
VLVLC